MKMTSPIQFFEPINPEQDGSFLIKHILQTYMQETLHKEHNLSPARASIGLIEPSRNQDSSSRETIKNRIIDEEMTHASEILAAITGDADIPRIYYEFAGDLIDPHGVSLSSVLSKGIEYLENSLDKRGGWQWELRRRKIEQINLKKIIAAPQGVACIEISPTDLTKPSHELREQGYTGDTLVRVSYKNNGQVYQRNIILNTSDIKILNALRVKMEKGTKKILTAEESLESMLFIPVEFNNFESFIDDFKNFSTNEISKKTPAKYLASLMRKSKKLKQNSWEVVNANKDIFYSMYDEFENLANSGCATEDQVNLIRAGVWQLIINRSSENTNEKLSTITEGIALAKSVGAVFTSCGGTVTVEAEADSLYGVYLGRYETVKMLQNKINGYGSCRSCGSVGLMSATFSNSLSWFFLDLKYASRSAKCFWRYLLNSDLCKLLFMINELIFSLLM
jgi:hypothetical protein